MNDDYSAALAVLEAEVAERRAAFDKFRDLMTAPDRPKLATRWEAKLVEMDAAIWEQSERLHALRSRDTRRRMLTLE